MTDNFNSEPTAPTGERFIELVGGTVTREYLEVQERLSAIARSAMDGQISAETEARVDSILGRNVATPLSIDLSDYRMPG